MLAAAGAPGGAPSTLGPGRGSKTLTIPAGEQQRVPLSFTLPADIGPGVYHLALTAKFSTGETQEDTLAVNVLAPAKPPKLTSKTALFDPKGETAKLLTRMGVRYDPVAADADLSGYGVLVVGKAALTVDGPVPDIARVRHGLKVVMFEQTANVLEKPSASVCRSMVSDKFSPACPTILCLPGSTARAFATGAARRRSCRRG